MRNDAVTTEQREIKSLLENRTQRLRDYEQQTTTSQPLMNVTEERAQLTAGITGIPDGTDSANTSVADAALSEVVPHQGKLAPEHMQKRASSPKVHTERVEPALQGHTREGKSATESREQEDRSVSEDNVGDGVLYTEKAAPPRMDCDKGSPQQRAAIDSGNVHCREELPPRVDNALGWAAFPYDLESANTSLENQSAGNKGDTYQEAYLDTSFPSADKSTKTVSYAAEQCTDNVLLHSPDNAWNESHLPSQRTQQHMHTTVGRSIEKGRCVNTDLTRGPGKSEHRSEVLAQQEIQCTRDGSLKTPRTSDLTGHGSGVTTGDSQVSHVRDEVIAAEGQMASKIAMDTMVVALGMSSAPPAAIWQSLTLRGELQHRYYEVNNEKAQIKSLLKAAEGKIASLESQLDQERRELTAQIDDLTERMNKAEELNASLSATVRELTERSTTREQNIELDMGRLQKERDVANANWEQEHLARSECDAQLRAAEQKVAKMRDMLEASVKKASDQNVDSLMRQFISDLRREKAQKGTQTLTDPLVFLRDYNLGSVQELLSVARNKAGLYVSFQALKHLDLCTVGKLLQKNSPEVRDGAFQQANEALQEALQHANAIDHKRRCFKRRNFIISPRYDAKLWSRQSLLRPMVPVEPLPKLVDGRTHSTSVRD